MILQVRLKSFRRMPINYKGVTPMPGVRCRQSGGNPAPSGMASAVRKGLFYRVCRGGLRHNGENVQSAKLQLSTKKRLFF